MSMTVYEIIVLAAAILGSYVDSKIAIATLKAELNAQKSGLAKMETVLEQLAQDIHEIKLSLARNKLDDRS
jgi:hypothetical protein